jgi:hypothetical protein
MTKYKDGQENPNDSKTWRYSTQFEHFSTAHIEEILASMEDSDRYISEMTKNHIIKQLRYEIQRRYIAGCLNGQRGR